MFFLLLLLLHGNSGDPTVRSGRDWRCVFLSHANHLHYALAIGVESAGRYVWGATSKFTFQLTGDIVGDPRRPTGENAKNNHSSAVFGFALGYGPALASISRKTPGWGTVFNAHVNNISFF